MFTAPRHSAGARLSPPTAKSSEQPTVGRLVGFQVCKTPLMETQPVNGQWAPLSKTQLDYVGTPFFRRRWLIGLLPWASGQARHFVCCWVWDYLSQCASPRDRSDCLVGISSKPESLRGTFVCGRNQRRLGGENRDGAGADLRCD